MGFKLSAGRTASAGVLSAGEMFPAGRRTKVRAGLPVCAEFVVFFALGRVTQDLVGLVDFLEFFLGLLFVFGDVGMILPREFAEGFFQLLGAGRARHAEATSLARLMAWSATKSPANPEEAISADSTGRTVSLWVSSGHRQTQSWWDPVRFNRQIGRAHV